MELRWLLAKTNLFFGCETNELEMIMSTSQYLEFPCGTVLLKEGEPSISFFIIINGTVVVTKIDGAVQQKLVVLGKGEVLGEVSLIDGGDASASVTVNSDEFDCLMFRKHEFIEFLEGTRGNDRLNLAVKVWKNLSRILAGRLRDSSSKIAELESRNSFLEQGESGARAIA